MAGIAEWFTSTGALADTNNDGYADDIAARFIVPGTPTAWEWCALADLAAVLGLHVTGFSPPLVVDAWDGPTLVLDPADDATLPPGTGRATLDGTALIVRGGGAAGRAAILRALAQGAPPDGAEWPVTTAQYPEPSAQPVPADPGPPPSLDDLFMAHGDLDRTPGLFVDTDADRLPDNTRCCFVVPDNISHEIGAALVDAVARLGVEAVGLTMPLCAPNDLGAAAPVLVGDAAPQNARSDHPALHRLDDGRTAVVIAGEGDSATAGMLRDLANAPLITTTFPTFAEPHPAAEAIWTWEWRERSERERLLDAVHGHLPANGPCDVLIRISEDATQRAAVREELTGQLPAGSTVTVLPVYHAARVWLEEIVVPAAKRLSGMAALDVACRPLIVAEDQGYLDLPIRWLQECWPADELLAPALGLPLEQVQITLGMADQEAMYHARARDASGATLGEWDFSVHTDTRQFLAGLPEQGRVHTTTGGVTIRQAGAVVFDAPLATDFDRFWDAWQGEFAPQLREFVLAKNDGHPTAAEQPFFDELRVEVWVSEPEYALGIREERESPAEGLAEDIYFNTLDYFHALGEQVAGAPWDEPGQIVPLVHVAPGEPPHAKVTLLRYDAARTERTPIPVQERSAGVAMDEVVTGTNLGGLLAWVNRLPGVTVRDVERSYQGRTIAAVEVVKPDGAAVYSRTKQAAMKPTHLINARHHANEVASTTAAFRLIELLATDPATMPLLDRCNVIVIPDENPDGTALHAMLMAEHPRWKHHAARYNAVGVEFGQHMGDPNTPYGEARVRPTLWRQWRPDVITDNHGVPSHEWWQPFAAGMNPPRFHRSYWLCEALIYGICRHAPDAPHTAFAEGMRAAVSRAVGAEPDLAAANQVYADRYERWGHYHVPEMFPGTDYHGGMLWFFRAAENADNPTPREVALNESAMLSASWVTEVVDETAQGAHLELVAKAHLTANLGLLRMMADNAPPVAFSATPLSGGRVHHRLHRMRPLPAGD